MLSKDVSCLFYFCADVIALSISWLQGVGSKPLLLWCYWALGRQRCLLPVIEALLLCAIMMLWCYWAFCQALMFIACLLYSIIGIDDSMPSHDQDVDCHVMGGFLFMSYFIFSSGRLNRMLSQMCGRLYFPIFLLRVGLFTLMHIASLMVLATVLSSLPRILKLSIDTSWPLILWFGEDMLMIPG